MQSVAAERRRAILSDNVRAATVDHPPGFARRAPPAPFAAVGRGDADQPWPRRCHRVAAPRVLGPGLRRHDDAGESADVSARQSATGREAAKGRERRPPDARTPRTSRSVPSTRHTSDDAVDESANDPTRRGHPASHATHHSTDDAASHPVRNDEAGHPAVNASRNPPGCHASDHATGVSSGHAARDDTAVLASCRNWISAGVSDATV